MEIIKHIYIYIYERKIKNSKMTKTKFATVTETSQPIPSKKQNFKPPPPKIEKIYPKTKSTVPSSQPHPACSLPNPNLEGSPVTLCNKRNNHNSVETIPSTVTENSEPKSRKKLKANPSPKIDKKNSKTPSTVALSQPLPSSSSLTNDSSKESSVTLRRSQRNITKKLFHPR